MKIQKEGTVIFKNGKIEMIRDFSVEFEEGETSDCLEKYVKEKYVFLGSDKNMLKMKHKKIKAFNSIFEIDGMNNTVYVTGKHNIVIVEGNTKIKCS